VLALARALALAVAHLKDASLVELPCEP